MTQEPSPLPPPPAAPVSPSRRARYVCGGLGLLFALALAAAWWLTPVRPYLTLREEGGISELLRFSADGSLLAVSASDRSRIWLRSTVRGEYVATILVADAGDFQWSPDGRYLVVGDWKGKISFWSIPAGKSEFSIEGNISTFTIAPDGKLFAVTDAENMLLYQLEEKPSLVRKHPNREPCIAIAPDLRMFASAKNLPSGESCEVSLWDMATGAKTWSTILNRPVAVGLRLSFLGNGKFLAAGWGWDHTTIWRLGSPPVEIASINSRAAMSPDGAWLEIGQIDVTLASTANPRETIGLHLGNAHFHTERPVEFSPQGDMLVLGDLYRFPKTLFADWLPAKFNPFGVPGGHLTQLWDVNRRRHIMTFEESFRGWFSPDGTIFATWRREGGELDLWRIPLRPPFWHVLGWAVAMWTVMATSGWIAWRVRRRLLRG